MWIGVDCGLAPGQIYIAPRQIYIALGQIHIAPRQIYDLIVQKYEYEY